MGACSASPFPELSEECRRCVEQEKPARKTGVPRPGAKELFDSLREKYGDKCEILTGIPRKERGIVTAEEVLLTSQSLGSFEEKLDPKMFIRCHKSYIIRVDAVKKLETYGRWTYIVRLKDTDETALKKKEKYDEIKQKYLGRNN